MKSFKIVRKAVYPKPIYAVVTETGKEIAWAYTKKEAEKYIKKEAT